MHQASEIDARPKLPGRIIFWAGIVAACIGMILLSITRLEPSRMWASAAGVISVTIGFNAVLGFLEVAFGRLRRGTSAAPKEGTGDPAVHQRSNWLWSIGRALVVSMIAMILLGLSLALIQDDEQSIFYFLATLAVPLWFAGALSYGLARFYSARGGLAL